jgi:multidrug efflux pump
MKSFNLSDWSLGHRSLIWYFMIAFMAAGLFSYLQLGRQEDPDFTIKAMMIKTLWPGAAAEEITREVTDRIEKKLEELESLDYTKSVTVAGQTTSSTCEIAPRPAMLCWTRKAAISPWWHRAERASKDCRWRCAAARRRMRATTSR